MYFLIDRPKDCKKKLYYKLYVCKDMYVWVFHCSLETRENCLDCVALNIVYKNSMVYYKQLVYMFRAVAVNLFCFPF